MGIFKAIGRFLKKLLSVIKKILAVLLIIIAVILFIWATICTAGATLVLFGFIITPTLAVILGVLAVVGAFLIDGKTASKVVGKIGEAAGQAAESVGKVVGNVAGGALAGLASSPVFWIAGGVLLLYFFGKSNDSSRVTKRPEQSSDAVRPRPIKDVNRLKSIAPKQVPAVAKPVGRAKAGSNISSMVGLPDLLLEA